MNIDFVRGFKKIAMDTTRRKYMEMDVNLLDPYKDDEIWSAKIDGAHAYIEFKKGERPRIYGHRVSKRTGEPIEYTEKVTVLKGIAPFNAVLRGEVYVTKNNIVQPPEVVTSVLNSGVEKSIKLQKDSGLSTNVALFDVDNFEGENLRDSDPVKKVSFLNKITNWYKDLTLPDIATTPDEKKALIDSISKGTHPQTSEGVVVYKGGNYIKAKLSKEHDVVIRNIFPEDSDRGPMAGGFDYSWNADGPIVGRVGTGFNFNTKRDMFKNPKKYLGYTAKVKALSVSKNNVLMKPSYKGLHIDKNIN